MDRGTVARIEGWEAAPYAGGYDGLRDLAADGFSGAVSAAGAWLFMLNGRVIGVPEGTLDAFEGADGAAYRAPHPSLPLLFAMRERGGETRARYYTDDTPLAEVDRTLSDGGFTGFVELSENVLSGDYYLLYYGGQSLSAAFIGSEERLLTGDEAFERANDEVGIYEVRTVDLDVREVPESTGAGAAVQGGATSAEPEPEPAVEEAEPAPPTDAASDSAENAGSDSASTTGNQPTPDGPTVDDPTVDDPTRADDTAGETTDSPAESAGTPAESRDPASEETDATPRRAESGHEVEQAESGSSEQADATPTRPRESGDEDPFSEEEEWREARTIPALDPDESATPAEARTAEPDRERAPAETAGSGQPRDTQGATDERVGELRTAIEEAEGRIADLEERLADATAERDDLRDERDRLRQRVRELEAEAEGAAAGTEQLGRADALTGTDVFVRYGSKGKATLDSARNGDADRDAVNENIRLETHTRFEEDSVAVDGRPFGEFLADTLEHRFVRWIVEKLLYEIRDTGTVGGLRDLYDALPRVDRIEFRGSITTRDAEGEERSEAFDVIFRDRMGSPLIVADLNDARDPATSEMMSDLVERATAISEEQESLAGAFLVTASFFEPAALETAADATDAGLLNRDSRKSFVKLSRKRGYHLCLVEARGDEFHVAVPEL